MKYVIENFKIQNTFFFKMYFRNRKYEILYLKNISEKYLKYSETRAPIITDLKHIRVVILLVLDDDGVIARQRKGNRVLVRVENRLRSGR